MWPNVYCDSNSGDTKGVDGSKKEDGASKWMMEE